MLNPEAKVTTVEFEEHHVDVARKNVEAAGLSERVEVIHGSGVDVLPELKKVIPPFPRPESLRYEMLTTS